MRAKRGRGVVTTSLVAVGLAALASVLAPSSAAADPQVVRCDSASSTLDNDPSDDYCQGYGMYDTYDECFSAGLWGAWPLNQYDYFHCEWVPLFNRWQVIGCIEEGNLVDAIRPD
jgi:hypothetical protein